MSQEDIEKRRRRWRRWYRNNPEKAKEYYRKKAKKRREKINAWWNAYRDKLSCKQCGEAHNDCLEFHHLNLEEKDFNLSHMRRSTYSISRIKKELAKCIVLCANCHRKEHSRLRKKEK